MLAPDGARLLLPDRTLPVPTHMRRALLRQRTTPIPCNGPADYPLLALFDQYVRDRC
jgi:hypothetical protein